MNKEIPMKTIIDMEGNEQSYEGCMACEINKGNLKVFGGILYESEYFNVMQDIELPIDGFVVIATKRHVEKLTDLSDDERTNLMELANKCLTILRVNNVCDEYNLILEEKKNYHFHLWLMPRANWMKEKFGKVLKNIKPIQEFAKEHMKTPENLAKIAKTCEILKKELNK